MHKNRCFWQTVSFLVVEGLLYHEEEVSKALLEQPFSNETMRQMRALAKFSH